MNRLASSRSANALLVVALFGSVVQQCVPAGDPPGSRSRTVHSCSPNYTDENKLGRLSVQQRAPGSSIQWGAYPKLEAARYVVAITIGGRKVDGKNQRYPPHGSLPGKVRNKEGRLVRLYRSGQLFKLSGTSYDPKGHVVQRFFIKCKLV